MNNKILITLIGVLLGCICLVVFGVGILAIQTPQVSALLYPPTTFTPLPRMTPTVRKLTAPTLEPKWTATPAPTFESNRTVTPAPTLSSAVGSPATADALLQMQIPERDLYQIVPRLRKNLALLTPVPTPAPRARKVGDSDTFFVVENASTGQYRTVTATLQSVTPHGYFWVENGMTYDAAALQKSADFWEQTVYPTDHQYFGNEKSPGPDGDVHIHILNTRFQDAAGYYSSEDSFPATLVPFSNARNIIYMNIDAIKFGSDEYNGDLAHEFQHLIHNYEAQHKTGWIDEGMGDLAIKVNGFSVGGVLNTFARNPSTQLNTWANDPQGSYAHYAASYLFFDYTALRFGPDFTRAVIHAPREGINGVQAVLDQRNTGLQFDDLFADWAVANVLNDPTLANGQYAYANEKNFRIAPIPSLTQLPVERTAQMHEYSTSYYTLQPPNGKATIFFTGTTTAKLIPANAHGGNWMWYSNRADLANMTLTRQVDLTPVKAATLKFWTWYDIETNYDYGYTEVSTDGGATWDILSGKTTTTTNPNGASYGAAFTAKSGVSDSQAKDPAIWVQEQMDLTPYAGKNILLRFEYITDDAYNAPGWAVDDITIPEINFADDVEKGANGWQAAGFVRTDNVLPQKYIVQVIEEGAATHIERITLDNQNRGQLTLTSSGGDLKKATIVINAFAPTTTEPVNFQLGVAPQ